MSKVKQRAENFTDIVAWSKALPESEWRKPSAQLDDVNDMLARKGILCSLLVMRAVIICTTKKLKQHSS